MKINLIQTVIVAWLVAMVSCLHLQQQPRMYDPDQYLGSLQTVQDQLKVQLNDIKQQFDQLDKAIEEAAYDPNQQLRLLQEGIADERDSLYQIQQYLTLPFNLRSCKCFNFSDSMRANLTSKLANVYDSLGKVQSKAKQCVDCEISFQIQTQIKYQKGYLKTMQETIDSKCCKVYTILYNDNLNASNWFYGNQTADQYKTSMAQRIKNASGNDTFVRLCPIYTPYVADDMKSCVVCEDQNALFNLQTRQCQQCPIGKIFNYDKHRCEFDVVCPSGSVFNQDTVMCQKIQPTYNDSLCPPDAPIWNSQTLGCYKCNAQTPFYDTLALKCTTCPDNTTYNPSTNQCIHKDCQTGQYYNAVSKQCQSRPITNVQISNSHCPEDRPYWDKNSLSCSKCPIAQPFYNSSSKSCQPCPESSTYDPTRNLCAKQCASGQQLNPLTMQCQNITTVVNDGSQASLCPPDRPIWNPQTKSCSHCAAASPFWNENSGTCQKCPVDQIWNETLKACQGQVVTQCPSGSKWNSSTRKCDQIIGSMAFCPPDRPLYNVVLMACTQCPLEKPNYDPSANECKGGSVTPPPTTPTTTVTCPEGYTMDPITQTCKLASPGTTLIQCPPATPIWDANKGTCVACPAGQQWNPTTRTCINCPDPTKCGPSALVINTTCQYNYQWNATLGSCVRCQAYQKYNTVTQTCDNFCKLGQFYDSNYDTCSGTISKCALGLIFNQQKLRCECPQGPNYRYVESQQGCKQFCQSNEYYDYLEQKCYPL